MAFHNNMDHSGSLMLYRTGIDILCIAVGHAKCGGERLKTVGKMWHLYLSGLQRASECQCAHVSLCVFPVPQHPLKTHVACCPARPRGFVKCCQNLFSSFIVLCCCTSWGWGVALVLRSVTASYCVVIPDILLCFSFLFSFLPLLLVVKHSVVVFCLTRDHLSN